MHCLSSEISFLKFFLAHYFINIQKFRKYGPYLLSFLPIIQDHLCFYQFPQFPYLSTGQYIFLAGLIFWINHALAVLASTSELLCWRGSQLCHEESIVIRSFECHMIKWQISLNRRTHAFVLQNRDSKVLSLSRIEKNTKKIKNIKKIKKNDKFNY